LVILLEMVFRTFRYGDDPRVFIEGRGGLVHVNRNISRFFFTDKKDARLGNPGSFKKIKSPGTYRIFVLGESSAQGYPYTPRGSFPRMLEYALERNFRDRDIEMINLSVTAINSFALLTFTREVVRMEPDIVLIYAGHNEYYGAMGVGSGHRAGYSRKIIKQVINLKKLRVSQLAINASQALQGMMNHEKPKDTGGFMHRMAGKQQIEFGSGSYYKGLEQFEKNMREIIETFQEYNIPVYFSNLVSNEKDQKPFLSVLRTYTDTAAFYNIFRSGIEAFNNGDYDSAEQAFLAANQTDSTHAMNNFMIGEVLYRTLDFERAGRYYSNARDLDALRFRAPEAINEKIAGLCKIYENVHFVDTYKGFKEHAEHGILGEDLFLDHLHPNLFGYYLIANSFMNTMLEKGAMGSVDQSISSEEIWNEMPVTAVDSVYGEWMCMVMKEQWPFYEKSDYVPDISGSYAEKLTLDIYNNRINMDMAMDSLYRYFVKVNNLPGALNVVKSVELDHPYEWKLSAEVGRISGELLHYEESLYYYKRSLAVSGQIETARKIVFTLMQLDRPEETGYYLKYLLKNQPDDKTTAMLLRRTGEVISFKKQLMEDPKNDSALFGLAAYYLYIRNLSLAREHLDKAVDIYPNDARTRKLMNEYSRLTEGVSKSN